MPLNAFDIKFVMTVSENLESSRLSVEVNLCCVNA